MYVCMYVYCFVCCNKLSLLVLERVLVVLRDGRTLIGFLRSVDQFGMWYTLNCDDPLKLRVFFFHQQTSCYRTL